MAACDGSLSRDTILQASGIAANWGDPHELCRLSLVSKVLFMRCFEQAGGAWSNGSNTPIIYIIRRWLTLELGR